MATKLIEKGKSVYEVTTGIKGKEWTEAQDKAFAKLAANVQVKGFRKGKAPLNLAKERISPAQMFDEAMNSVLPKMFNDVVVEHKLNPLYRPNVTPTKISDTELEVTFRIICVPDVKLGKYTGIEVALDKVSVSADEVKVEMDKLLEDNAELVVKETEPAAKGDTVVMDFKGYVDGKEFEGGSAENYSLVLGSNSFIPGFEDQLIGSKAGDKVTVNVTFPKQYMKELAGKDAKFACTIHEVKSKKTPELNDEFVKGLNMEGVSDVKSLEASLKEQVKTRKTNEAKSKQFGEVLKTIIDGAKIEMADEILANETAAVKEEMVNQMTQNGLSLDQYKEITGMSDDQLHEQFETEAKNRLTQVLVLNKIAETEKLIVSKEEIKSYYEDLAKQYSMKIEDVEKALQPQESRLIQQLLNRKIETFIIENNGMGEKKAAPKAEEK